MRLLGLITGFITTLCAVAPARAATITFSDLKQEKALGIHVNPTGPTDLPFVTGWIEVYGGTGAFLTNSPTAHYYSGTATFKNPINQITFDVSRLNNSGLGNAITLIGLENHKRVASTTVNLLPLGDITHVTLNAPEINQVVWRGTEWIFHPYVIRDVKISFATESASTGSSLPSGVGSPVPEPGSASILGIAGMYALLRRRRQPSTDLS